MAVGVRQLYVGLEAAANGEAGDPASEERADARTRTGDPFITSEVLYQLSYVGKRPTVAVLGSSFRLPRAVCQGLRKYAR
jgi:hypothetical protein